MSLKFDAGVHKIIIYGIDDKYDGPMDARFTKHQFVAEVKEWSKVNIKSSDYANDMKLQFDAATQPAGFCTVVNPDWPVNIRTMCNSKKKNGLWKIDVTIFVSYKGYFQLDFGADFVGGVVAHVDDNLVYAENWDHYW